MAGSEVGERFADAGAGLDEQVIGRAKASLDGGGHLELLGPVLEVGEALGDGAGGGEEVFEVRGHGFIIAAARCRLHLPAREDVLVVIPALRRVPEQLQCGHFRDFVGDPCGRGERDAVVAGVVVEIAEAGGFVVPHEGGDVGVRILCAGGGVDELAEFTEEIGEAARVVAVGVAGRPCGWRPVRRGW